MNDPNKFKMDLKSLKQPYGEMVGEIKMSQNKFSVGDRVRVYGLVGVKDGGVESLLCGGEAHSIYEICQSGYLKLHGSHFDILAHPKQCRRLIEREKKVAREWTVATVSYSTDCSYIGVSLENTGGKGYPEVNTRLREVGKTLPPITRAQIDQAWCKTAKSFTCFQDDFIRLLEEITGRRFL